MDEGFRTPDLQSDNLALHSREPRFSLSTVPNGALGQRACGGNTAADDPELAENRALLRLSAPAGVLEAIDALAALMPLEVAG